MESMGNIIFGFHPTFHMCHDVSDCSEVKATVQREREQKQYCGNCSAAHGALPLMGHLLQEVFGGSPQQQKAGANMPKHTSVLGYSQNHALGVAGRGCGGHQFTLPAQGWSLACLECRACVHWFHLGLEPWSQCVTSASLSSLTLSQGKNIHFCAKGKAAGNSINQVLWFSGKIKKRTQKLRETPLTKIQTFSWGHVRIFAHWPFGFRSFLESFHSCLEGSSYLLSSWRHPTFGWSLPPCHRRARTVCRKKV